MQQQGKPVRVTIIPSAKVVTQGEPLTLRYRIENHWDREVMVNLGFRDGDWLNISLVRPDGSQIKAVFLKPYGKWHNGGNAAVIQPEQDFKEDRVIPRWGTLLEPGQYQLSVRVQLPYAVTAETFDADLIATGKKSVYKTTLVFPITVTPANPGRLTKMANEIKEKLLGNGNYSIETLC